MPSDVAAATGAQRFSACSSCALFIPGRALQAALRRLVVQLRKGSLTPRSPELRFSVIALGAAAPAFTLPSGYGTAMGATLTFATPLSGVIPIFFAVEGEISTIRPCTYGPRFWMVTFALWPVSRLVTLAVVPSGSVLLATLLR